MYVGQGKRYDQILLESAIHAATSLDFYMPCMLTTVWGPGEESTGAWSLLILPQNIPRYSTCRAHER